MSGGGGFRGRGFASHRHHRQSSNGPGAGISSSRGNGPNIRSGGIPNSRLEASRNEGSGFSPNVQGGEHASRSIGTNSRPDGPNARLGSPIFRGGGGGGGGIGTGSSHGPRPNFNLPRRPPRHPGPAPNWNCAGSPRGGSPHFTTWRGVRPPRFSGPPRPFYRGRGQNNFGQYRYPYMGGNLTPIMLDFPPMPEPKPTTPLLGSEEERLQKITEAADELKRKLCAVPNGPDVWYNENDDDAAMDFNSDRDYESRITGRGIPELKHDPPELNLTLSDLRDIGRVDHDHLAKQAKASSDNAWNSSFDDTEVEILDYNPVRTTIEIDVWSDDDFVEFEEGNSNGKTNEQLERVTETIDTAQNAFPDNEENQVAEMEKVDSIADENMLRDATSNEDSQELRKNQKPEEEVSTEAEMEQRNDDENQKPEAATEASNNKVQNTRIEDEVVLEESRTESNEDREELNETTSPAEENKNAASHDKKVEDVRLKLHDVNVNKTILGLSEERMLAEKESRNESANEPRVDLESANCHAGASDVAELLNGNESTKESANVREFENECPAVDESRDNPETAIVTSETKESDEQTSSDEIKSEVRKDDASLEKISQGALTDLRSEEKNSLSSDGEKNKAQYQENVITKNAHNASVSDEKQVSQDKRDEPRNERQRENSKKNAKEDDPLQRDEDSAEASSQSECSKNRNNSNGSTENSREKTENPEKLDSAKSIETEKNAANKHKLERSSLRDEVIDDPKSPVTDGKVCERRKLVRKISENTAGSRNRRSVRTDSPVHSPQRTPRVDFDPCEPPPVIFDPRAPPPARPYGGNNCRMAKPPSPEPSQMNHQLPPVFDPRLSMHERSALIASGSIAPSSIPIGQDPFGMAPGYPLCPMTNFVPNVPTINYGVPRPPIEPPPMLLPDSFTPLIPLPPTMATSMRPSISLKPEASLMIQPPLPIEPPPPPPPPVKSANLDMVDELEDMQEAMEFAKKFMNMGDVGDMHDVDDSADSNFFHMPTFPDLPPIELPPLPPPAIPSPIPAPPPSEIPPPPAVTPLSEELENIVSRSRRQSALNKDSKKNAIKRVKQEPVAYGPEPMPEDYRSPANPAGESFEDPAILNDDAIRPKVIFNLNSKMTKLSKPEVFQQHDGDNAEEVATSQPRSKLSALPAPTQISSAMQEKLRLANGRQERETTRVDGKPSRFNGIVNFLHSKKLEETSQSKRRSRSPSPSKRDKNSRGESSHSTPDRSEQSSRRGSKDASSKKSTDSGTLESSWKSRVISKFLKMSKNDICNMLNNSSLRKFDIAMKHLVKERRSSLSLGMRNSEEEKMRGADVSYNQEEFMDQLSAMLDPSATVDVCNLPTQFIHHLSEVLQLDSKSDFEAALTPSESVETPSPTPIQPPPSVSRIPRASSAANVKEIDDRRSAQRGRDKKSMRTSGSAAVEASVASSPASTPATIPTTPAATRKVETRTCDDLVESRCAKSAEGEKTKQATIAPRAVARRRRGRPVNVEVQDSMTVNNGATSRSDSNSLNMADLDDIFSPGIAREKKKLSGVATVAKNDRRSGDVNLPTSARNNEVAKDSSVDRVERAAVELDKIFTAGIARFKLPSIKAASAAARVGEVDDGDVDDEEDDWHCDDRNVKPGPNRPRQRSMSRSVSKGDKWNRRKTLEDRDAFRNLTKEEWDAKYGESSYSSYEQEYRAMVASRARRYELPQESEAITDVRSRLGNQVTGDSGICEAWSGSDDGARFRNMSEPMNFEINAYNRSSGDESPSSNSMSSSSDSSDEESQTAPSVTKLLKVIKAKEKIAKQKSLNEEIRDEVAAEIEKNRRERGKLHKSRHKSRLKKSHRRKKDRKEKKKKGRKRRRRRSRRSGSDSRDSSGDSYTDEDEYTSSALRSRKSSRILTENEIKKEIVVKDEPELESLPSTPVQRRSKSSSALRSTDEARPPSTSSSSSMPAVAVTASPAASSATNYLKTKAQLKQMPVNVSKVAAATVVSKEIAKSQELPVSEAKETPSKIVAAHSLVVKTPSMINEAAQSSLPSSSTPSGSSAQIEPALNTSNEPIPASKSTTKKLDIKVYMERARQRKIRETERLRQITENPTILTQNLLNIPVDRKNVTDAAEDAVESGKIEQVEDRRMEEIEKSQSTPIPTTTCNLAIICASSDSRTVISTTSSAQTVVSTTTNPLIPSASSSPLTISSTIEATKVSASQSNDSQPLPSKNVAPKKLVRKRSVTTDPKIAAEPATNEAREEAGKFAHIKSEGSKEMKLREKPKKSKPRAPVKGLESTIEPAKPARVRKRSSVSSRTSTDECAALSSEKNGEDQVTVATEKRIEEHVASASEKPADELAEISSEKCVIEPAAFTSGPLEKESAPLSPKQRRKEQEELATEKSTDEPAVTHSGESPEEAEMNKSEKSTDGISVTPVGEFTEESVVISSGKSTEERAASPVEKSTQETAVIPVEKSTDETAVIPVDKSAEELAATPTEKSTTVSVEKSSEEATSLPLEKISDVIESKSNDSDLFKKQSNSEDYLPTLDTTEKLDVDLVPESELDPLAMRITDLPDWPLEDSISPNVDNDFNDSGDDPPFRGFTKDTIILQDRVLTEAEENIAEMDRLGKVPLTFVDDPDTSTGGGLDLDDVTSTGVSLDAPQSYGDEEFVESGVETSLLGFPVENDITDEPENQIALDSENDRVTNDLDKSTVHTFVEESSQETTDSLPRVTPTLSDSPAPDDFLAEDVTRPESVPSPILVAEAIRGESIESPDLSPTDKVDEALSKENTAGSPVDAAEVGASLELENKEPAGTTFPDAEPLGMDMGSLQSSAVQDEKEIYIQMSEIQKIGEDKSNILPEFEEKLQVKLAIIKDPIHEVANEVKESSSRNNNNAPVDSMLAQPSQHERSNEIGEKTKKEITTGKVQSAEEPRAADVKTKDSLRGVSKATTKEHSHSRSKRKSSRHHGSKTDKKSTLTEKTVEDAISTNIVKLVSKPSSKETVLARMVEIDVEIHKLMNEKMTLYTMLQSGEFPAKDSSSVEGSGNKSNDDSKSASEREETAIPDIAPSTVLASHLARNLDKNVLIASSRDSRKVESHDSRKVNSELDGKAKKRKKSPPRELKNRSKESDQVESRRERDSESKNHSRRTTSEETTRRESSLTSSREKSTSSTDLDDSSENRRKRKTKLTDSSNRNSSKEDLKDASRDSADRSIKSAQHEDSPKREKEKKKNKTLPAAKKIEESTRVRKEEEEKSNAVPPKATEKIGAVIYSDESTWDSLDPESIPSDEQRLKKDSSSGSCTGLALLEETFKREMAQTRKHKAVEKRKNKKQELRRIILDVPALTPDEEEIPLSDLYHRKNTQKKAVIENKRKSGVSNEGSDKVAKHITSVIDAVAADRVEQLYTGEVSPVSDEDSTPASSLSLRGFGTDIERERSPSISVAESVREGSADPLKKSKPEEPETAQRKNSDSRESDQPKPEEVSESKLSKKSKKNEENNLFELKQSEIEKSASESERSSPVEIYGRKRYVSTSSGASTPEIPDIESSARKNTHMKPEVNATAEKRKDNENPAARVEKSAKKNESTIHRERETGSRAAEASRSPSPGLPRAASQQSRSVDAKLEAKEKHKHESSIPKEKSSSESSAKKSAEKNQHVYSSKGTNDERARSNSRTERPFKRRSVTPRETGRERERKDRHSSRGDDSNDREERSSGRPKSATKRRHREKSGSLSRRNSRHSEERVKRSRSKKRDRERSDSRGNSPHDSEPARKKPHHSHRSSSPKATSVDDQARRRGRKRKAGPEISREAMMNCKVQLIDCKYTYLSPNMNPRVLKKFGISRINPYVAPTLVAEPSSPPQFIRVETPSPPTLSKVEAVKPPTLSRVEVAKPSTLSKVEVVPKQKIKEAPPPRVIHNHEDENRRDPDNKDEDGEAENDDGVDETIHYIKVVDSSDNPVMSDQDEDIDAPQIIDETSCRAESAPREVISVEDETTDEIDPKNDPSEDIEVLKEKVATKSVEKTAAPQQKTPEPEEEEDVLYETKRTRYTVHKGPILDIKVLDDSFLAASEDGAIYRYSQTSNGILNIYKGHEAAVTCIHVFEVSPKRWNLYSGSLDGTFRCYNITTGSQDRPPAAVGSPVQCMDQGWGIFYVGTKSGHISRYSIKSGSIKGDRLEFSDNSVLALKACAEGPRRVLIVASRNQPITIRDALTGLFLRTISGYKSHTVYSLMREKNLVYCGTSGTSIPVFDFINGEQVTQYNAGVGIVCMRLYRQILFAGCYDGNIYVFDTKESRLIISIPGPGNMLLSMEIVGDEIIAGSKNRQLHSWSMPRQVRALLSERA